MRSRDTWVPGCVAGKKASAADNKGKQAPPKKGEAAQKLHMVARYLRFLCPEQQSPSKFLRAIATLSFEKNVVTQVGGWGGGDCMLGTPPPPGATHTPIFLLQMYCQPMDCVDTSIVSVVSQGRLSCSARTSEVPPFKGDTA